MGRISRRSVPFLHGPEGGPYKYRRTVPSDVRPFLGGKSAWIKSFPRRTRYSLVVAACEQLAADHDQLISRVRAGEVIDAVTISRIESRAADILTLEPSERYGLLELLSSEGKALDSELAKTIAAVEHGGRLPTPSPRLSSLPERYPRRDPKPPEIAFRSLVAVVTDKVASDLTRSDVLKWINACQDKGQAPGTILRRLNAMKSIYSEWLRDYEINKQNPFSHQKIPDARGNVEDRAPFHIQHLELIDSYIAENKRIRPETVQLIRFLQYTGCSLSEITGLAVADIFSNEPTPYLVIRPNRLRDLKTLARQRIIPVADRLLPTVEQAIRRAQRGSSGDPETLPVFSYANSPTNASATLNNTLRRAGIPKSRRLTAYSMRHTFKEALRTSECANHIQDELMGHASSSIADRYGAKHRQLREKKAAIEAALDVLGQVDLSNYRTGELPSERHT
ncbi:MAG: tyrosine-type recombinase/integrase [Azospirillaceae bacterium]